jgi:hypothetical protein
MAFNILQTKNILSIISSFVSGLFFELFIKTRSRRKIFVPVKMKLKKLFGQA